MFIYMGDRWNFDGPGSVSHNLEILHKGMQHRASLHMSCMSQTYLHSYADKDRMLPSQDLSKHLSFMPL